LLRYFFWRTNAHCFAVSENAFDD